MHRRNLPRLFFITLAVTLPLAAAIPTRWGPAKSLEKEGSQPPRAMMGLANTTGVEAPPAADLAGPPPNDNFANATLIVTPPGDYPGGPFPGDNINATKEPGESNHAGEPGGHSVWWKWTAPGNVHVSLYSVNSDFVTALGVYTGSALAALTPVPNNPFTAPMPEALFFDAPAGTTYYIAVDGVAGAVGNVVINLGTLGATPPAITSSPTGVAVATGGETTLRVVATGSAVLQYQWYLNNVPIPNEISPNLLIFRAKASDAGTYHVVVRNSFGSATSAAATVTITPSPLPVITTQPGNQSLTIGQTATFNVAASSATALTYQWSFNGNAIAGAAAATLNVPNVQPANAGTYTVTVSNGAGGVTSLPAQLLVFPVATKPVISTHPASQTVLVGANVSFNVVADGYPDVSYQWLHNGSPIAGATGTTVNLTNVQSSDAGSYVVNATNTLGTTVSNTATLTVNAPATPPPSGGSSGASGGGGGGGGAPSWYFLAVVAALAGLRRAGVRQY